MIQNYGKHLDIFLGVKQQVQSDQLVYLSVDGFAYVLVRIELTIINLAHFFAVGWLWLQFLKQLTDNYSWKSLHFN